MMKTPLFIPILNQNCPEPSFFQGCCEQLLIQQLLVLIRSRSDAPRFHMRDVLRIGMKSVWNRNAQAATRHQVFKSELVGDFHFIKGEMFPDMFRQQAIHPTPSQHPIPILRLHHINLMSVGAYPAGVAGFPSAKDQLNVSGICHRRF